MAMEEGTTTTVNFPQGMNPWGMNGWGQPWQKYGMSGSALGIGIAALVAGGLALLGGRIGNFGVGGCDGVTQRDLANERLLSAKDAEIGKLQSQLYTDQQVNALRQEQTAAAATQAVFDAKLAGALDVVKGKVAMLDGMLTPVLAPQVLAPSQAVLTQFQAAKTAAATSDAASNG
jgi:hypothetical protein